LFWDAVVHLRYIETNESDKLHKDLEESY